MDLLLQDRATAGRQLAAALADYRRLHETLVLGITAGGVVVAEQVAEALQAPLDMIVVRPLVAPPAQGAAVFGAIATGGIRTLDWGVVSGMGVSDEAIETVCAQEETEIGRLTKLYRGERLPVEIAGRRVILVDEGLDSGTRMHGAVAAVRALHARTVTLAVPVARFDVLRQFYREADDLVCLATPYPFESIARWYWEFPDVTQRTVRETLQRHWEAENARPARAAPRKKKASVLRTPMNDGDGHTHAGSAAQ